MMYHDGDLIITFTKVTRIETINKVTAIKDKIYYKRNFVFNYFSNIQNCIDKMLIRCRYLKSNVMEESNIDPKYEMTITRIFSQQN